MNLIFNLKFKQTGKYWKIQSYSKPAHSITLTLLLWLHTGTLCYHKTSHLTDGWGFLNPFCPDRRVTWTCLTPWSLNVRESREVRLGSPDDTEVKSSSSVQGMRAALSNMLHCLNTAIHHTVACIHRLTLQPSPLLASPIVHSLAGFQNQFKICASQSWNTHFQAV